MKKNNGGYSLVEIIIVVAIMSVLTGGIFYSVSMVFGANAKTCANDLRGAIAQNKITAMGKSEAKLTIYRDASNQCIYAKQSVWSNGAWEDEKAEKISNAKVYVAFVPEGGTAVELTPGDSVEICFDRSSGSFKANQAGIIYSEILVRGGNRSFKVVLKKLTGKVSVEVN